MKYLIEILNENLKSTFKDAGFEIEKVNAQPCSMPELGDYQCNDCLSMAKQYKMSPMIIAQKVVEHLKNSEIIGSCTVAAPGFINIFIKDEFLNNYLGEYIKNINNFNFDIQKQNVIIDYGGANVAKPLHVGHLRSATIGESIKRIVKAVGNNTLGDVHLGDWGLQMGMVISEIKRRQPDLPYFDDNFKGEYPSASPITITDLETLYPEANAKAKADENCMNEAKQVTFDLQNGKPGCVALWKHILNVSKEDLKKNYDSLNVNFDLWLGESDTNKYYTKVIEEIKSKGFAYESEGALVVDVAEEGDKIDVPPFILIKSDGAVLYSTTDLATIVQREKEFDADRIIYVVDNRQSMHFTQLFRCANKTGVTKKKLDYNFVGFGTMNGKDGRPYKTRDGGVMQLKTLITEVKEKALEKVKVAKPDLALSGDEMIKISNKVAISALKFADLSIFRTKDYNFDPEKFCSFDGKTGPYLLYTVARAKSILRKIDGIKIDTTKFDTKYCDRKLLNLLVLYHEELLKSYIELAPSYLCDYIYKIANQFNSFYATCNIVNETDQNKKNTWILLTQYTLTVMEKILFLLGIETLEKM